MDLKIAGNGASVADIHLFGRQVAALEHRHFVLIHNLAMIDDDHPFAERFDVTGIVRGEQHPNLLQLVHALDRLADACFGHHIQANRRFIQQNQARLVQQRSRDFAAHPLAE